MNIKFVVVSKNSEFFMSNDKFKAEGHNVSTEFIPDNKTGLPKLYNRFLDEERNLKTHDYLVFMHADVIFNVQNLVQHLDFVEGKYDILGLCGASKISVSQSPLNWWVGSNPFPLDKWGCVKHEGESSQSYFSQHSPSVFDVEAACIDGLCMIFSKKALDTDIRFDENLGDFSFYDTDLSLQAFINYKLKLGVLVQMDLVHGSLGKSILGNDFLEIEKKFREKWHLDIPKGSKLEKYLNEKNKK